MAHSLVNRPDEAVCISVSVSASLRSHGGWAVERCCCTSAMLLDSRLSRVVEVERVLC